MRKRERLLGCVLLALFSAVLPGCRNTGPQEEAADREKRDTVYPLGFLTDTLDRKSGRVRNGENFMGLLMRLGLSGREAWDLSQNCPDSLFDVRKMRAGNDYDAYYLLERPRTEQKEAGAKLGTDAGRRHLHYLVYHNSRLESTVFALRDSLHIYKVYKEITCEDAAADVTIQSSLWNDMQAAGAPVQLILDLSDIYAWTVDFFGLQKGDRFRVLYRKKFCEGEPIGIDTIRYAIFSRGNADLECIMFNPRQYLDRLPGIQDDAENGGADPERLLAKLGSNIYWNEKGESMRKTFLKAPLHYSRISSGFSYARKHPVTRKVQPHTGVDYAAPTGTPVMTIGDGTVLSVKYEGAGGNTVRIRHNSVYTTAYLHLSKYGKGITPGARVSQGQVIGYVGATGRCTGPHLDFRVWKNGSPVNPLTLDSPPAEPLPEAFRPALDSLRTVLRERL